MEGLQGQGERFDEKKEHKQCSEAFVTSKTDTALKASRQSFLRQPQLELKARLIAAIAFLTIAAVSV